MKTTPSKQASPAQDTHRLKETGASLRQTEAEEKPTEGLKTTLTKVGNS